MRLRGLGRAVAAGAAVVLAVTISGSALGRSGPAGAIGLTVAVTLGGTCMEGNAPIDTTVTATLRSATGKVLDSEAVDSFGDKGQFWVCFSVPIQAGQRLVLAAGDVRRTIAIPRLDGVIDRVANRITGHAPALEELTWAPVKAGYGWSIHPLPGTTIVRDDGTFSKDMGEFRVEGGGWVDLGFTRDSGDTFGVHLDAPFVELVAWTPTKANVTVGRAMTVRLTLRTAAGKVRATAVRTVARPGTYSVTFRDTAGRAVAFKEGDRVRGNIASDLDLDIPRLSMAIDTGTGSAAGQCFPSQKLNVSRSAPGYVSTTERTADADGEWTLSGVVPGDLVTAFCRDARGDRFKIRQTAQ